MNRLPFQAPGSRAGRQPGWYIPWLFVAFFAVVVVANAIMILAANRSWTGLETEDHFRKGLVYNRNLEAVQEQMARGWQVQISATTLGPLQVALGVRIHDAGGVPLQGGQAEIRLIRPTQAGQDQSVILTETAPGLYQAQATTALPGQWDARLLFHHPAGTHQQVQRILVAAP